jgi:rubrerythrin
MNENDITQPSINACLEYALKVESKFASGAQTYYKMTRQAAFKRFLLSLLELSKEHIKSLKELRQEGNLDSLMCPEASARTRLRFDFEKEDPDLEIYPHIGFLNFLAICIKRKGQMQQLYNSLKENITNQDVAFLFKRLADDEKKQKDMLLDRYELEILSME